MGGTQHTIGNNNTRAYCALQLALGNMGVSGGGANIFRGHDNVQGATDLACSRHTLPGYYGLSDGAWKHWSRGLGAGLRLGREPASIRQLRRPARQRSKPGRSNPMNSAASRLPLGGWRPRGQAESSTSATRSKAMFFWGHAPNSQTRGPEMKKAMEKLELVVVMDPYPTHTAVLPDRKEGMYLLPAARSSRPTVR